MIIQSIYAKIKHKKRKFRAHGDNGFSLEIDLEHLPDRGYIQDVIRTRKRQMVVYPNLFPGTGRGGDLSAEQLNNLKNWLTAGACAATLCLS